MSKKLVVLSGPSGAGLGDIAAAVFAARKDVVPVVPVTARKMKEGEKDGVGFYFYDLEGWNALKESGDLIEATEFAGNDYGTSRRLVKELLDKGLNVMIDRSVDRAAQRVYRAVGARARGALPRHLPQRAGAVPPHGDGRAAA